MSIHDELAKFHRSNIQSRSSLERTEIHAPHGRQMVILGERRPSASRVL
jgi:hypothetical protein